MFLDSGVGVLGSAELVTIGESMKRDDVPLRGGGV
jgi:hypothetical protein